MKEHSTGDTIIRDVAIVAGIALLIYVSNNITPINIQTISSGEAIINLKDFVFSKLHFEVVIDFLVSMQSFFAIIGLIFFGGIIWLKLRSSDVHHHEHEKYEAIEDEEVMGDERSTQWKVVLNHVNSENPAEWKIAILEADNMLDEILEDQGYVGETVADKLKMMSRTRITSYDALWDAHKLRNLIAHEKAVDVDISKKIARDAVASFESAFKELGYL